MFCDAFLTIPDVSTTYIRRNVETLFSWIQCMPCGLRHALGGSRRAPLWGGAVPAMRTVACSRRPVESQRGGA